MKHRTIIEQWMMRIVCIVALVFAGFAHQVPALAKDNRSPADLAQYRLPDGTQPTLCITGVDEYGTSHGKPVNFNSCEACRIGSSLVLPTPADTVDPPVGSVIAALLPLRMDTNCRQLYPPNKGPRAPPSVNIAY